VCGGFDESHELGGAPSVRELQSLSLLLPQLTSDQGTPASLWGPLSAPPQRTRSHTLRAAPRRRPQTHLGRAHPRLRCGRGSGPLFMHTTSLLSLDRRMPPAGPPGAGQSSKKGPQTRPFVVVVGGWGKRPAAAACTFPGPLNAGRPSCPARGGGPLRAAARRGPARTSSRTSRGTPRSHRRAAAAAMGTHSRRAALARPLLRRSSSDAWRLTVPAQGGSAAPASYATWERLLVNGDHPRPLRAHRGCCSTPGRRRLSPASRTACRSPQRS